MPTSPLYLGTRCSENTPSLGESVIHKSPIMVGGLRRTSSQLHTLHGKSSGTQTLSFSSGGPALMNQDKGQELIEEGLRLFSESKERR